MRGALMQATAVGLRMQEVEAEARQKLAARQERREREQRRLAAAAEAIARAESAGTAAPRASDAGEEEEPAAEDRLPDSVVAALAERARCVALEMGSLVQSATQFVQSCELQLDYVLRNCGWGPIAGAPRH